VSGYIGNYRVKIGEKEINWAAVKQVIYKGESTAVVSRVQEA